MPYYICPFLFLFGCLQIDRSAAIQDASSSSFLSSLSFEDEINQELVDLMDRMDSGAICSSSPFTSLAVSRLDHSCIDVSGELLFSEPSPSPLSNRHHRSRTSFYAITPTNTGVQMTTPITSPANTSRCKVGIKLTIQKPLMV